MLAHIGGIQNLRLRNAGLSDDYVINLINNLHCNHNLVYRNVSAETRLPSFYARLATGETASSILLRASFSSSMLVANESLK